MEEAIMEDDENATCKSTYATLRIYLGELDSDEVARIVGVESTSLQKRGEARKKLGIQNSRLDENQRLGSHVKRPNRFPRYTSPSRLDARSIRKLKRSLSTKKRTLSVLVGLTPTVVLSPWRRIGFFPKEWLWNSLLNPLGVPREILRAACPECIEGLRMTMRMGRMTRTGFHRIHPRGESPFALSAAASAAVEGFREGQKAFHRRRLDLGNRERKRG